MKKLLSILMIICTLLTSLSLFSCGNDEESSSSETADEGIAVKLDLTEEWNKISNGAELVQGCVVVRKEFAQKYPESVNAFLDEYKASIEFTNANPQEAGSYIAKYKVFEKAPIATKAIPNCNIAFQEGNEMKSSMSAFISAMYSIAPASVGKAIPGDDFYYARTQATGKTTEKINVAVLNGTTGFGIAKLMADNEAGTSKNTYEFSVETAANSIMTGLSNGSIDIAALPTNAASNIYNVTGGKVQALAINTLGVLYVLEDGNTVNNITDLEGKIIYCPAQNPTFILQYILKQNNINATIDSTSYAAPADLRNAVANGTVKLAVLPEPMVTIVLNSTK